MTTKRKDWVKKQRKKRQYRPLLRRKNPNDRDKRNATKKKGSKKYRHGDYDKKRAAEYYDKNREARIAYSRNRQRELYYKVFQIRYQGRCVKCGNTDYRVLDFDHIDPSTKIDSISGLVSRGSAWWRIEEELAKCQLLCANCHRVKTFEKQAKHDFELEYLIEYGVMEDPHFIFSEEE